MRLPLLAIPAIILLAGCVNEEQLRTEIAKARGEIETAMKAEDQKQAAETQKLAAEAKRLDEELGKSKTELQRIAQELAKAQAQLAGADQALAGVRSDLAKLEGSFTRATERLMQTIEASRGMLRQALVKQRDSLADQLRQLTTLVEGMEPAPAPAASGTAAPAKQ